MLKSLHTPENQKLIRWLKDQRNSRGLTMRQLAAHLGVQHSFIGKVEQGERRLDVVEYINYCRALEVNPHDGLTFITGNK